MSHKHRSTSELVTPCAEKPSAGALPVNTSATVQLTPESVSLLLREHERVSDLYHENRQMGESRTSLFLTVVSLAVAALAAVSQYASMTLLAPVNLLTLLVLLGLGLITFHRLVERRIMGSAYLRAINRIHGYFVEHEPELQQFLSWPACDDCPPITAQQVQPGLRDVVQLVNGFLSGVLLPGILLWLWPSAPLVVLICIGIIAVVFVFVLQQTYERTWLQREQRRAAAVVRRSLPR